MASLSLSDQKSAGNDSSSPRSSDLVIDIPERSNFATSNLSTGVLKKSPGSPSSSSELVQIPKNDLISPKPALRYPSQGPQRNLNRRVSFNETVFIKQVPKINPNDIEAWWVTGEHPSGYMYCLWWVSLIVCMATFCFLMFWIVYFYIYHNAKVAGLSMIGKLDVSKLFHNHSKSG